MVLKLKNSRDLISNLFHCAFFFISVSTISANHRQGRIYKDFHSPGFKLLLSKTFMSFHNREIITMSYFLEG